jgi:hypothetical protein
MADIVGGQAYMLVDQEDCNVLPIPGISVKSLFDRRFFCLGIDNKKVLLGIWRRCNMLTVDLSTMLISSRHPIAELGALDGIHTPIPASSKPVTESCIME